MLSGEKTMFSRLCISMIFRYVFAASATAIFFLSPIVSAHGRLHQDDVRELRGSGKILPMEDIIERTRAAQPGQIVEVDLEHEDGRYVYEVKVIDERDVIHGLELDAATGEVLRHKEKERNRRKR